jgi:cholesterol 25-hydroxylase
MSFYDPENISDLATLEYERRHRVLQPLWELLKNGREDALRSPLFPPVLAVTVYVIIVGFFTLLDTVLSRWPLVSRYKIQKEKQVTGRLLWLSFIQHFWNHLLYIFPMAAVQLVWVPPTPLPVLAPTLFSFLWQQLASFFLFDFYYWCWHLLHHKVRVLYRFGHATHHQYHSTFAAMTSYLHPWELITVGMGISVIPWLFRPHIMTSWSFCVVANYVSIEVHCGYDFPWQAHNWCGIYGGAPKHDMHHLRPMSNFEPWLNYLDRIFGFELKPKDFEDAKAKKRRIGLHNPVDDVDIQKFN